MANKILEDLISPANYGYAEEAISLTLQRQIAAKVEAAITEARKEQREAVRVLSDALKAANGVINDMRSEYRLHGQITDASSAYLHRVEPQINAAIAAVIRAEGEAE